jgi:hypothetical protein
VKASVYTAADLATYCAVELRTIHNWLRKQPSSHTRTGGGQMRFSRLQVVDFLRAHKFPVPRGVRMVTPHVALITPNKAVRKLALTALGRRFQTTCHDHLFDAALAAHSAASEAFIVESDPASADHATTLALLRRLREHPELSAHRRVAFVATEQPALRDLVHSCIMHASPGQLRAELLTLLGCAAA